MFWLPLNHPITHEKIWLLYFFNDPTLTTTTLNGKPQILNTFKPHFLSFALPSWGSRYTLTYTRVCPLGLIKDEDISIPVYTGQASHYSHWIRFKFLPMNHDYCDELNHIHNSIRLLINTNYYIKILNAHFIKYIYNIDI